MTGGGEGELGPSMDCTFMADLWQYDGESPWGFVTLPAELSQDIRAKHGRSTTSVGSIKVTVTIGGRAGRHRCSPSARTAAMCSPSRESVRTAEQLEAGSPVEVRIELR